MIFVIIIAALVLGVALMNEYGWADLTGNSRNNLVFETRNKEYGAYQIRQKYSNRLVVAFFGSLGIITLAAFSPKFFPSAKAEVIVKEKGPHIMTYNNDIEKKKEEPKEEIRENKVEKKQAAPKAPDVSTIAKIIPKPTVEPLVKDTTTAPKNPVLVTNVTHTGTDTSGTAVLPRKPGKEGTGECLDCPPPTSTVMTPPEVTKQADFDYQAFFRKNLRIPDEMFDLGITGGKIYVAFVVDEQGNVTNVSIKKGLVPVMDNEVKRVASIMPKWSPAQFNENRVKVRMVIPINITLGR